MFLLVPAYPGCPGSKAVKRSSLYIILYTSMVFAVSIFTRMFVLVFRHPVPLVNDFCTIFLLLFMVYNVLMYSIST